LTFLRKDGGGNGKFRQQFSAGSRGSGLVDGVECRQFSSGAVKPQRTAVFSVNFSNKRLKNVRSGSNVEAMAGRAVTTTTNTKTTGTTKLGLRASHTRSQSVVETASKDVKSDVVSPSAHVQGSLFYHSQGPFSSKHKSDERFRTTKSGSSYSGPTSPVKGQIVDRRNLDGSSLPVKTILKKLSNTEQGGKKQVELLKAAALGSEVYILHQERGGSLGPSTTSSLMTTAGSTGRSKQRQKPKFGVFETCRVWNPERTSLQNRWLSKDPPRTFTDTHSGSKIDFISTNKEKIKLLQKSSSHLLTAASHRGKSSKVNTFRRRRARSQVDAPKVDGAKTDRYTLRKLSSMPPEENFTSKTIRTTLDHVEKQYQTDRNVMDEMQEVIAWDQDDGDILTEWNREMKHEIEMTREVVKRTRVDLRPQSRKKREDEDDIQMRNLSKISSPSSTVSYSPSMSQLLEGVMVRDDSFVLK